MEKIKSAEEFSAAVMQDQYVRASIDVLTTLTALASVLGAENVAGVHAARILPQAELIQKRLLKLAQDTALADLREIIAKANEEIRVAREHENG
jgi:hypothetical protein